MVNANNNGAAAITPTLGVINATFCQLPVTEVTPYKFQGYKNLRYRFETGTGVSAGAVGLQELGEDGNYHVVKDFTPVTVAASTVYSGAVSGPFLNAQLYISTALVGGNITYIELKGEASDPVGGVLRGW